LINLIPLIVPISSSSQDFIVAPNNSSVCSRAVKLSPQNLLAQVDLLRLAANSKLTKDKKVIMGQFLTPTSVADFMAGMFHQLNTDEVSLLDAGAGVGSLLAAFVAKLCKQKKHPSKLRIVAYEIDSILINYLNQTLELCAAECQNSNIILNYEIREQDFIEDAVKLLQSRVFTTQFTHAIINPPYLKIKANSKIRQLLSSIGLETSNLYTGFMALTAV
jgi:adenine-specific DNA-methyltransferase